MVIKLEAFWENSKWVLFEIFVLVTFQTGIISPSKLRMKLIGVHHQKKKTEGSNSNSSRTSPARLEDSEFVNNSLLAIQNGDFEEECMSISSFNFTDAESNFH